MHKSNAIPKSLLALTLMFSMSGGTAFSEEISGAELQKISFRVVKNANGWFRILKTGAMTAMTLHDVYSLGLDAEEALGEFTRTVAVDTKNDTVQLVTDVGTLGSYVATDVAAPILSTGYEYTSTTILPAVAAGASSTYAYTTDTVIPKTGELAVSAYEASKPVVSSAYKYTTDTVLPAAGDVAAAGGTAIANGASSLWKWATD